MECAAIRCLTLPFKRRSTGKGFPTQVAYGAHMLYSLIAILSDFVLRADSVQGVWIDKGRWVFPSTLEKIKAWTGALLVHYTPDPAFIVHTSRHFEQSLSIYDLCVTTKRYELERYREAGAKQVVFTWQGIDDRLCGANVVRK